MKKPIKKTTPKKMCVHEEINEHIASVMSKICGKGNKIKNKITKDLAYSFEQVDDLKEIVQVLYEFQHMYLYYANRCDIVIKDYEIGIEILEKDIEEKDKLEQESQRSKIEA